MMTKSAQGDVHDAVVGDSDDIPTNPLTAPTFGDVVAARFSRRDVVKGALGVTAIAATMAPLALATTRSARAASGSFTFDEIEHGVDETHHVAPGYDAKVLLRWGDPVFADAPAFDPNNQTPASQLKQFGYNCDFEGYFGLPEGSTNSKHGILCVNHEYTNTDVMFPGLTGDDRKIDATRIDKNIVDTEMAAHGCTVIEIQQDGDAWSPKLDSKYNRRISTLETEIEIAGPAAGVDRMKTKADPTGRKVIGTVNNCAGGVTPWGTYLTAEENFHQYFLGEPGAVPEEAALNRYGVAGKNNRYAWGNFHDRFDITKEPNEPNRFGWIVEIDPYDPASTPKKRTAIGRFKHEGAESIVNKDGRVVVYSGDDQRFDYLYKFVTAGKFDPNNRAANMDLLDEGTLYVAKFHDGGKMNWLPLVHGQGPLTEANGFSSQADVVIEARRAGDLLGATPMDRPEDVEPNKVTNKVYVMLTNNTKRKEDQVDAVNPRANNTFGHIVELTPPDDDHAADTFSWDIIVKCGDPAIAEVGALWNPATSRNGWFAAPDNCAVDSKGRLWISTDQGSNWSKSGTADGIWALETDGELRGTGRMLFRVPIGAEMCGPCFTPDSTTLFVAVQHPATDGTKAYPGFERKSTFEDPATRWPDFRDGMPPRPSVVAIIKKGGGEIGG